MNWTHQEIEEFRLEALELLSRAERSLLLLKVGDDDNSHGPTIYRAFHKLRGLAGMLELARLQSHMSRLETFVEGGDSHVDGSELADFLLKGCDIARVMVGQVRPVGHSSGIQGRGL